jgi:hydrogenase maturation protease
MRRQRVVCVGNELCHDDGVAYAVGEALKTRCSSSDALEIVPVAELGLSCLDAFLDVEHVIVVDALTTGSRPGTCEILTNLEIAPRATCSIGHAISLASMLELVAQLQPDRGAPKLTVIGIEAEDLSPFGTTLSPSVLGAVPRAVDLVMAALSEQS